MKSKCILGFPWLKKLVIEGIKLLSCDTVASDISRKKWSMEEIDVVTKVFHKYIIGSTLPGKTDCLKLIVENKCLRGQSWTNVKDYERSHNVAIARKMKNDFL